MIDLTHVSYREQARAALAAVVSVRHTQPVPTAGPPGLTDRNWDTDELPGQCSQPCQESREASEA